jgi:DNA-3-methyladenine glycosylase
VDWRRAPSGREIARQRALLGLPTVEAARRLVGMTLVRTLRGRRLGVRIVETEAYLGASDPAAHAFRGRTPRTEPLWGPPGTVYVYFIYGMHHCLNVAVDRRCVQGCVLIRAGEPLEGTGLDKDACRGPGRLCRALAIDRRQSGASLLEPGAALYLRDGERPSRLAVSPRVGIREAASWPLRFFDPESAAVTKAPRVGRSAGSRV